MYNSRALEGAVKSKGFDNSKGKDSTVTVPAVYYRLEGHLQ